MANDLDGIVSRLEEITADVKESFGDLSSEQLNWKPAPESWSVGQCLEHLIMSNEGFFPELDKIVAGSRRNTLWQSWSPLSGIAGAFLVSSLKKDNQKVKTIEKMTPASDIGAYIVDRFAVHQAELIGKLRLTADTDWHLTVLTSPFVQIMTYRMDKGLEAVIEHEKRHIRQAKRVKEMDGFPKIETKQAEAIA
jgi:DinB family protein